MKVYACKWKVLSLALAITGFACGEEEKKEVPATATGNTFQVSFEGAEAGQQYLIVPFATGDQSAVDGAGSETLTFKYEVGGEAEASELKMHRPSRSVDAYDLMTSTNPTLMDRHAYDHGSRLMIQLFDREKGEDQNPAIWNIARELDGVEQISMRDSAGMTLTSTPRGTSHVETVKNWIKAGPKKNSSQFNLTQATCTVNDGEIVRPDADLEEDFATVGGEVIEEADYCIVIVDEPTTVTTDEIKAAATAIMQRYKTVIYKDDFTGATDFTFKPIIAVIDFKDTESGNWAAENSTLNSINGVFIPEMSDITKHPMVYMAADLGAVLGSEDAAANKRFWYGTLAHEMQHAISDFLKKRKGSGSLETVAIEEGQAHFMEALFGYGDEVYKIHAKPFLSVWHLNGEPLLRSNDIFELSGRGAAYTMLYYLASRKGGVEFTDGVVSGGGGLDYVLNLVKDSEDEGVSHLSSEFGGVWIETLSNYISALAVDGTDVEDIADKHTVDAPKTGVADLGGGTDNAFGFRFYSEDLGDRFSEYEAITGDTFAGDVELKFYEIMPALYTVEDPEKTVTITSSVGENWGVTKVRVK